MFGSRWVGSGSPSGRGESHPRLEHPAWTPDDDWQPVVTYGYVDAGDEQWMDPRSASPAGPRNPDLASAGRAAAHGRGGTTRTVQGFFATRGYDLASGWGTGDAARFVPA